MNVLGVAGWSGGGKTTLITKLLPVLIARGLTVSTIKHAHHGFAFDTPGKDSYRHREAGAREVLVASSRGWALVHETRDADPPNLRALLRRLSPCDLVLVEGFRGEAHPKVEVHRVANAKPFLFREDINVAALVSDARPAELVLPYAHIDAIDAVADLAVALAAPWATDR